MWRSVLGVIVGCLAGGMVAFLVELPSMFIHPLPPGMTMSDREAIKTHMANAPLAALLGVAIAWTAAPFVAAWLAGLIARRARFALALFIALLFVTMDMLNVVSFPHPKWLIAIGIVAPLMASYLGALLATRMAGWHSGPRPYDMRQKNMAC